MRRELVFVLGIVLLYGFVYLTLEPQPFEQLPPNAMTAQR